MERRFTDMLGDEVVLNDIPQRIVSLVPSQTELLFDLGLEDEVVGITKFCIHPEQWFRSKTRIGGTKQVHIDKVASLQPDLIIANKEENVKEQIDELRKIAPVWVSDIHNLAEAMTMISGVGEIVGKVSEADEIVLKIETSLAALRPLSVSARNKVTYCIWRNPWMWAGTDTFISDMLDKAGFTNALSSQNRYPEIELEQLKAYKPDLIFLSSEPYPFKEKHIEEIKSILPETEALLIDGEMFSWYGSRLLHAASYLNSLILRLQ